MFGEKFYPDLKQYFANLKILTLSFLRDRQTVFFVMLLPLIFLSIFGSLYSQNGQGQANLVAIYYSETASLNPGEISAVIEENSSLAYQEVASFEEGEDLLRNYQADILLEVGDNRLDYYFNPVRLQDNPALEQQAALINRELDVRRTGMEEYLQLEIRDISPDSSQTGTAVPSRLFSLFPGLIALGMASSGLFVIVELFHYFRERGVLKRLGASPLNRGSFIFALVSSRLPGSLLSSLLVLLASRLLFGVSFEINWLLFIPYLIIGTVIMMGLGALITLVTTTADSGFQAANILLTVMIFFSGIYFPIEFLPSYFQRASTFLPLTYLARGMQQIMGVSPLETGQFLLETGSLLIISLLLIIIVAKKSSWTD